MKFKVGDRVRYIKYAIYHNSTVKENSIWKIIKVDNYNRMYYTVDENYSEEWFREEELEKIEYTYEDLKKSPIGTKLTFENGEILIKNMENNYESYSYSRYDIDLKDFKDGCGCLGKIMKIEEPEYITVYENKEILDEAEKRYLRGVIKPFKDKVKYIKKCDFSDTKNIEIGIKKNSYIWKLSLPPFEKDMMYKNMEDDKQYTLEELGL